MYVLQHNTHRLLQDAASATPPDNGSPNAFNLNAQFNPSMAIILVVLLAAFFFMGFFSIYIKRCSTRGDNEARVIRTTGAAAPQPPDAETHGVDAAFLEGLPLVTYSSSKKKGNNVECVVCLTDFDEGEPLCQLPRCKHVFHKECIDMWLFSHTTCPLCRRSVISDGSRSFRWGGSGSLSLRLSLGQRGSRRGSRHGSTPAGPATPAPIEQQRIASQVDANARTSSDLMEVPMLNAFPKSHSTGHLLEKKQAHSREIGVEMPDYGNTEDVRTSSEGSHLPRSRSVAAVPGSAAAMQGSISAWMREAGTSLRRVMSMKKVNPSAVDAATTARSAFDRLNPV